MKTALVNDCGVTGHLGSRFVTIEICNHYKILPRNVTSLTSNYYLFEVLELPSLLREGVERVVFNGEGCFAANSGDRGLVIKKLDLCLRHFDHVTLVNVTLEDEYWKKNLFRMPDEILVRDYESMKYGGAGRTKFRADACYLYVANKSHKKFLRRFFSLVLKKKNLYIGSNNIEKSCLIRDVSTSDQNGLYVDMVSYLLKGLPSKASFLSLLAGVTKNLIKMFLLSGFGHSFLDEFRTLLLRYYIVSSNKVISGRYHGALIALAYGKPLKVMGYSSEKFKRIASNYSNKNDD